MSASSDASAGLRSRDATLRRRWQGHFITPKIILHQMPASDNGSGLKPSGSADSTISLSLQRVDEGYEQMLCRNRGAPERRSNRQKGRFLKRIMRGIGDLTVGNLYKV